MTNILLLHGAIGSNSQLEALSQLLSNEFNVLTLNFSGHGGEKFQPKFSIEQFANDVVQFLDKNSIDKIDVFGYSMGGYVALYIAKHFPNRIGRIVTLGTKFKWNPEIALNESKMLNPEKIEAKIPAFAAILDKRHLPNNWKEVLAKTAQMMKEMGEQNPLIAEDYRSIKHQVKIGLAENDEMVSLSETQNVVNYLQNASFYSLLNSKHPIEKANLNQLTLEIKKFLL